jgi:hypothetical protein
VPVDLKKYAHQVREAFKIQDIPDALIDYVGIDQASKIIEKIMSSPEFAKLNLDYLTRISPDARLDAIQMHFAAYFTDPKIDHVHEMILQSLSRIIYSLRPSRAHSSPRKRRQLREMERRRILLSYFIPDVFETAPPDPTGQVRQYDRRFDLIDGCIYYLEVEQHSGRSAVVLTLWRERAKVKDPNDAKVGEFEQSVFGHLLYHPILMVIDRPQTNAHKITVPALVNYARVFRGYKQKISIFDQCFFFTTLGEKLPITPDMLGLLRAIQQEIQPPFFGMDLKTFMAERGYSAAAIKKYNTIYWKMVLGAGAVYNRGSFGLNKWVFYCPYPDFVQISALNVYLGQQFYHEGRRVLQQIWTHIPVSENWEDLLAKFRRVAPKTLAYRVTDLQLPKIADPKAQVKRSIHAPFQYFDLELQSWRYDWADLEEQWIRFLETGAYDSTPLTISYPSLTPTRNLLKICRELESSSLKPTKEIAQAARVLDIAEAEQHRRDLEQIVAFRSQYIFAFLVLNQLIHITIPGCEHWKFSLLAEIGKYLPSMHIMRYENLEAGSSSIVAIYALSPPDYHPFFRSVTNVLDGRVKYALGQYPIWKTRQTHWYELYDESTESWRWNVDDYFIKRAKVDYPPRSQ